MIISCDSLGLNLEFDLWFPGDKYGSLYFQNRTENRSGFLNQSLQRFCIYLRKRRFRVNDCLGEGDNNWNVNTYDQEASYTSSNLTVPSFSAAEERPRMIIFQQPIITTSQIFA